MPRVSIWLFFGSFQYFPICHSPLSQFLLLYIAIFTLIIVPMVSEYTLAIRNIQFLNRKCHQRAFLAVFRHFLVVFVADSDLFCH